MSQLKNPFVFRGPVSAPEVFVGREAAFTFIERTLAGGQRARGIVIEGRPGIGRSSLLAQIEDRFGDRTMCALIDPHGLDTSGPDGGLLELSHRLLRTFPGGEDEVLDKAAFEAHPASAFERGVVEPLKRSAGSRRLVITIDDAEHLWADGQDGSIILKALQRAMRTHSSLGSILAFRSGSVPDALRSAPRFSLSTLEREEAIELIKAPIRSLYALSEPATGQLLELSGRHPQVLQQLCHALFEQWPSQPSGRITLDDVERVADEIASGDVTRFEIDWTALGPSAKAVLSAVAEMCSERGADSEHRAVATPKALLRHLSKHGVALERAAFERAGAELVDAGLLRGSANGSGALGFEIDLLQRWIVRQRPLARIGAELAAKSAVRKKSVGVPITATMSTTLLSVAVIGALCVLIWGTFARGVNRNSGTSPDLGDPVVSEVGSRVGGTLLDGSDHDGRLERSRQAAPGGEAEAGRETDGDMRSEGAGGYERESVEAHEGDEDRFSRRMSELAVTLVHDDDAFVERHYFHRHLRDFRLEGTFENPSAGDDLNWDFGVFFRELSSNDQLRVAVRADGTWSVRNKIEDQIETLAGGRLPDGVLDTREGGSNRLVLTVDGDFGRLEVNDDGRVEFDLGERLGIGNVSVVTGIFEESESTGLATEVRDVRLWAPNPKTDASWTRVASPERVRLPHDDDDLIERHDTGVSLGDFRAEAKFDNPEDSADLRWDYGFRFRRSGTNSFIIVVRGDGEWQMGRREDGVDVESVGGRLPEAADLLTGRGESNDVAIEVVGVHGRLLVNGVEVAELELEDGPVAGSLDVVSGVFGESERVGSVTEVSGLRVWAGR